MLDKSREYSRPAWLVLLCILFLPLAMPHSATAQSSASGAQTTKLMQQMDYRQRVAEQRAEADRLKASPLPPVEDASVALDYVILAVLAGSTAALLVISRMKRRPRLARRYPPYYPPR
jgi:hypothetical protein